MTSTEISVIFYKFRLESLKWEFDTYPSFNGEYGQQIISNQIGDKYQLFIGIMNQKFGSPTKVADSGTVEEFNIAFKKLKTENNSDIFFYFNTEVSGNINDLGLTSLQKIKEFKASLAALGGLYFEYKGTSTFENSLRSHVIKYLNERFQSHDNKNKKDLTKNEYLSNLLKDRFNNALCAQHYAKVLDLKVSQDMA